MKDFRPISYCNTVYKCITKILTDRLNACLNEIISPNQIAFVTNRNIAENVLVAQEVVKNNHTSKENGRCTIKVKFRQAYDSVEWPFILQCLCAVGFPPKFVGWVRECTTSPEFSVAIIGE